MSTFSQFFIKQGFRRINENNVFQTSHFYTKSINLQRKSSGDKYFINLGVSPIIPNLETFSNKEIDAIIRFRIHPQGDFPIETINSHDFFKSLFESRITDFFDNFMSIDDVFSPITLNMIENRTLPNYLMHTITQTALSHVCAKYWLSLNNIDTAKEFAHYGLSKIKLGGGMKKVFKEIIKL